MLHAHACASTEVISNPSCVVVHVLQDEPPDALTQQLQALPSELQQVLADMQGLANASAAEFGLLDIHQTRKNNRSTLTSLSASSDSRLCMFADSSSVLDSHHCFAVSAEHYMVSHNAFS